MRSGIDTSAETKNRSNTRAARIGRTEIWEQMRNCYDPEIPVNIVDLGLIYDCKVTPLAGRREQGGQ